MADPLFEKFYGHDVGPDDLGRGAHAAQLVEQVCTLFTSPPKYWTKNYEWQWKNVLRPNLSLMAWDNPKLWGKWDTEIQKDFPGNLKAIEFACRLLEFMKDNSQ